MPALQTWQERLGGAARLLHPPLTHSSSLLSQTGLPEPVKFNTRRDNGATASALTSIHLHDKTKNGKSPAAVLKKQETFDE